LALHALNKAAQPPDDPWYDKIPNYDRWAYWHFGPHIAIPKPFEIGAIFGELPVQMADAFYRAAVKDEPDSFNDLWKFTASTVMDTFAMNPLGQGMVIVEQAANKDFFRDKPIVPQYMERLEPALQWDHHTSKTARLIGETTNVSPMRIDHVVDKMFSYAGGAALAATDFVLLPFHNYPDDPALTMDDYYWLHGRIPRGKQRYIKQEQEFYALFAEVDRVANSFKKLREINKSEAREYKEEHRGELRVHPRMTRIKTKLADIRKRERKILNDPDLSPDEKRERLDELIDKRHEILMKQLEKMKGKITK